MNTPKEEMWQANRTLSDDTEIVDIQAAAARIRENLRDQAEEIREELEEAGWPEDEIERELEIPDDPFELLHKEYDVLEINEERGLAWVTDKL